MTAPLLGVACSATGRRWIERPADPRTAADLALKLAAPEALGRVLAARGVAPEGGDAFLNPSLKASFPDPATFADMDRASEVLEDAIARGRRIAVFADYDVDGATSAALLLRYLRARGTSADLYVPDRIVEGYGPTAGAFQRLAARGAEVVVTVDCGAMAHGALEAGKALGLDIVVLDHHQMTEPPPPDAAAVVNPNRPDCTSGAGHLAAAGVTFVTLAALNRRARAAGVFANGRTEPDLLALLDLAALGTFCDVVPLTGFNRALAAQGLKVMSARGNPGLAALAAVAGAQGPATAYTAGFVYGPRINAGGRVGRADLGARLLSTDDPAEAAAIAAELHALNSRRREVEDAVLAEAVFAAEADIAARDPRVIVVAGTGWHPGVIGIVAGRLKERFHRPVIVLGVPTSGEGDAKGSGRSIPGVDLGGAIAAVRRTGLLVAGGGHAMAAGLTVAPANIAAVAEALEAAVAEAGAVIDPEPRLDIDAVLAPSGLTRALAEIVGRAGPFGAGNPEPVFATSDQRIAGVREVGAGGHLRVTLADEQGAVRHAIAFRARERGLEGVLGAVGSHVHAAFVLKPSDFGAGVDLQLVDAAAA